MSANSKRIRIVITNPPPGSQPTTSLEHARRYVRRGTAEWNGSELRFIHRRQQQAQQVTIGRIVSRKVESFGGSDSGFNLLRYPLASQSSGAPYRTLERLGAGL
jgi:hypothetical protein